MTKIRFRGMTPASARALRDDAPDAYGNAPEHALSDGGGAPCRHCMSMIEKDAPMLIAAHRPFEGLHAYTETGPIFLCANGCAAYAEESEVLPPVFDSPTYILRGYSADERIVYGTGAVTPRDNIIARGKELLARDDIAFVHIRSAANNCWQGRIERA